MSERDAYVAKMKAKLDEWNAEILEFEAARKLRELHDAGGGPHPPEALKLELPVRSTKLPPRKKRKPGTPGKRRRPPPGKSPAPHPPQPPAPRRRRARGEVVSTLQVK